MKEATQKLVSEHLNKEKVELFGFKNCYNRCHYTLY